jgi:O-antigen ligase
MQSITGLTTDKNILGAVTFILLLGSFWSFFELLGSREARRHQRGILVAKGTIVALGIYLFSTANSVTSESCFAVGAVIILATNLRVVRRHPTALHALVLVLVVGITSVLFLGVGSGALRAMGRNPTLTGRTDIWAAVIPLARNPIVGAGFESFWLSSSVHAKLQELIPGLPLNEAHNGYIEVYLELGWVGVFLIAGMLIEGYRTAFASFRRSKAWSGLPLAYVVSIAVYSASEAGFRMMNLIWIFFLMAVAASCCIAAGVIPEEASKLHRHAAKAARRSPSNQGWRPEGSLAAPENPTLRSLV